MRRAQALAIAALLASASASAVAQEFQSCLGELRASAIANGVSPATIDSAFANLEPDATVLEAMDNQPELETPVWEYLARLVDDKRIADGKAMLAQWRGALNLAHKRYGVDRQVIVAVWGVETDYGRRMGRRPLVRSLATLSCSGARQEYFRGELVAALKILQSGDVPRDMLRGSWAGAFGHAQFMPSTFQRSAVDLDGDGKRDVVDSVPDALGSIALYLKDAGWKPGEAWGYEVKLPAAYSGPSGRRDRRELSEWNALGIRRMDGRALVGPERGALLLPAGVRGPAFMVFANFDAIYRYNNSVSYALSIAHLADRLKGRGPIATSWPTDDPALTRVERIEMQLRLIERGFYAGAADGIMGSRTVEAIKAFQASRGIPPDGYGSSRVLKALREG